MTAGWIVPINRGSDGAPQLFCFSYAGGGTSVFRAWAPFLPDTISVHAVLTPGRERRFHEPPVTDFSALVDAVARQIITVARRPFALFGHSLGASVAYEVARLLQRWGAGPETLFVSGRQAPGLPTRRLPIARLPDHAFFGELTRMGGTPAEVLESPELMALLLPMLRADFALAEDYRPFPSDRLACSVQALGGEDDPWVDLAGLRAWRNVTDGPLTVRMFPGDHFYLQQQRADLLTHLCDALADLHRAPMTAHAATAVS